MYSFLKIEAEIMAFTKELQNFWNFSALRAQNLRAIGQRTHGVAAAVDRVGSALTSEEGARQEPR